MRRALTPRSLRPTREAERTSMRLPFGAGVTRTTMSSVKPNQRVVSLASRRPSAGAAATMRQPIERAAASARAKAWPGGRASISGAKSG